MESRRSAVDPGRVTVPELPEEHQGWGAAGYAGGATVPSAETPGWGVEGHVEGAPARPDATGTGGRATGPDGLSRPGVGPVPGVEPGWDEEPGPHPASVLAGR